MRINGGGYAPWRLHGAETPGEAAARTRAQWCEQTQDLAPVSTMDWRVQVVYRFAVSPERWGPVAAQLMRGLLGGQDVLRDAGNAAHWTLGETSLYALLSEHPGALPARAGATCGLTLCQDGCRFGVWHDGRPDWGVPDLPFGGLCHAILAALQGGCIDDITSADAQWLGERLPAFVRRHPALATRAWEHVMAGMIDADGVAAPNGPGPVRALAQSAALLGAAGIAGYVLSDLPMWGIVVSTSLEAAAMARAIVALPRGGRRACASAIRSGTGTRLADADVRGNRRARRQVHGRACTAGFFSSDECDSTPTREPEPGTDAGRSDRRAQCA